MTQSGAASVHLKHECFTVIHKTLKSVFENVAYMVADIPSFGCNWGFNLASDGDELLLAVSGGSIGTSVCVHMSSFSVPTVELQS